MVPNIPMKWNQSTRIRLSAIMRCRRTVHTLKITSISGSSTGRKVLGRKSGMFLALSDRTNCIASTSLRHYTYSSSYARRKSVKFRSRSGAVRQDVGLAELYM